MNNYFYILIFIILLEELISYEYKANKAYFIEYSSFKFNLIESLSLLFLLVFGYLDYRDYGRCLPLCMVIFMIIIFILIMIYEKKTIKPIINKKSGQLFLYLLYMLAFILLIMYISALF